MLSQGLGLHGERREAARIGRFAAAMAAGAVSGSGILLLFGALGANTVFWCYALWFLLALSFLVTMVCLQHVFGSGRRVFGQISTAFAVMYATTATIVYYTQLTGLHGKISANAPFVDAPGHVFFSVDMLGYVFLCISVWFAVPLFSARDRLHAWIRALGLVNGLLAISTFVAPALFSGGQHQSPLIGDLVLLLWCILFAPLMALYAASFQQILQPTAARDASEAFASQ